MLACSETRVWRRAGRCAQRRVGECVHKRESGNKGLYTRVQCRKPHHSALPDFRQTRPRRPCQPSLDSLNNPAFVSTSLPLRSHFAPTSLPLRSHFAPTSRFTRPFKDRCRMRPDTCIWICRLPTSTAALAAAVAGRATAASAVRIQRLLPRPLPRQWAPAHWVSLL